MQVPPPHASVKDAAPETPIGPVNVELLGVVKSTWNR
jgi:hypothetical protein